MVDVIGDGDRPAASRLSPADELGGDELAVAENRVSVQIDHFWPLLKKCPFLTDLDKYLQPFPSVLFKRLTGG